MKIVIGSDHAGFALKNKLIPFLRDKGFKLIDIGTDSEEPVDYPDYAKKLSLEIINKNAQRGILICGSGVGACVAANKFPGIRAGICHDIYSSHQSVEHDNINVLVLGARIIGSELARELVISYLNARFSGDERHIRRLKKIEKFEVEDL